MWLIQSVYDSVKRRAHANTAVINLWVSQKATVRFSRTTLLHGISRVLYIYLYYNLLYICICTGFDLRQRQKIFLLVSASRPALGPTQPPVQWVPGVLSRGVKHGRGVMLTTHPHLVPRLSMSRSYTSSPPCASMECSGTVFFFFFYLYRLPYL
jgi:hypothetical protein